MQQRIIRRWQQFQKGPVNSVCAALTRAKHSLYRQGKFMPESSDSLHDIVLNYQQCYKRWHAIADSPEREELRQELHHIQGKLWTLLEEPLMQVAKGWIKSAVVKEILPVSGTDTHQSVLNSVAMSLYIHVLDALPKLKLDPQKNLLACLMLIVRRRLIDQMEPRPPQSDPPDTPEHPISGTSESAMWLKQVIQTSFVPQDSVQGEYIDPQSQDAEEQQIDTIYQQQMWHEVLLFWRSTLAPEDWKIMQRWGLDPPTPFRTIAEALGPGWNESMVRQRHHRIMRRTRKYLHDRGLLDGAEDGLT